MLPAAKSQAGAAEKVERASARLAGEKSFHVEKVIRAIKATIPSGTQLNGTIKANNINNLVLEEIKEVGGNGSVLYSACCALHRTRGMEEREQKRTRKRAAKLTLTERESQEKSSV